MKITKPYKIIMADDHILFMDALANLINSFDEFDIIAKAANGNEVINALQQADTQADIVLMDLNMPEMDGYETAKKIAKQYPDIKIVILTMYDSEIALLRLLQTGVCGFLKKDIHPRQLKTALLTVAAGEYYYSNHTNLKIASFFKKNEDGISNLEKSTLNEQEIEFLKLCTTDLTYKEIARTMNISPRNIDSYRVGLFTKLNVQSRVGMAIYAIRNGIITF
jgi:two-component system, NarL family, invasion response regulator UvrY